MNKPLWATTRLRAERERLGLKQSEMVEYLKMIGDVEMAESTYQKLEANVHSAAGPLAVKIANALEIPFTELFTNQAPKK